MINGAITMTGFIATLNFVHDLREFKNTCQ